MTSNRTRAKPETDTRDVMQLVDGDCILTILGCCSVCGIDFVAGLSPRSTFNALSEVRIGLTPSQYSRRPA